MVENRNGITDRYVSPLSERYASREMQEVFSPDRKFRTWRKLWIALAETEKELGLDITDEQIEELKAHADDINYEDAKAREKQVRHDVMSHVYAYGLQCPKAKGIIHLGATSCYVGDNTDIILMREALGIVRRKLINAIAELAKFADEYKDLISGMVTGTGKFAGVASPGETRQLSILSGMNKLKDIIGDDDFVIIHDAARPLVSEDTIRMIAENLKEADAVLPVLPMKDTVYEVENGKVVSNLDRSRISAGQAPEGFRFGRYLKANEDLLPDRIMEISGSMQPAVTAGMDIACIGGDERNFKITTPADLARFEELIRK